jgi:ribokinase
LEDREHAVEVIALGDINVDIIAHVARYPAKGEDALAESTQFRCGGSAANTAVVLARLGQRVTLIARIGPDPWASIARRNLEQAGVRLAGLQVDAEVMTGLMYIVVTPDGERTMLGDRGANARTSLEPVQEAMICNARLLHLSGYALLAEPQRNTALCAVETARRYGLKISVDPGLAVCQEALDQMRSLLPVIELLLPTLPEAQALTGLSTPEDCIRELLDLGVETIALKLGSNGCLIATREHSIRMPAFMVDGRDSTGAGDSFAAGVIAALLSGLGWESAAALANALGAATSAQRGAEPGRSTMRAALALLRDPRCHSTHPGFQGAITRAADFLETTPIPYTGPAEQIKERNQ